MKASIISSIGFVVALGLVGCGDEDTTPTLSATVSPTSVTIDQELTVSVDLKNFELDPDNYGGELTEGKGHWHAYLDTVDADHKVKGSAKLEDTFMLTDDNPLAGPALAGEHKIIIQLFNNDHTALEPIITQELAITVTE